MKINRYTIVKLIALTIFVIRVATTQYNNKKIDKQAASAISNDAKLSSMTMAFTK